MVAIAHRRSADALNAPDFRDGVTGPLPWARCRWNIMFAKQLADSVGIKLPTDRDVRLGEYRQPCEDRGRFSDVRQLFVHVEQMGSNADAEKLQWSHYW